MVYLKVPVKLVRVVRRVPAAAWPSPDPDAYDAGFDLPGDGWTVIRYSREGRVYFETYWRLKEADDAIHP